MEAASVVPLDYEAIGAALTLLVGAISATVFGLWRGWNAIKKSLLDPQAVSSTGSEKVRVVAATITETQSLNSLTESNQQLRTAVCDLIRHVEDMVNEMKKNRYATEGTGEAMQRLTSAIEHNSRVIERTGLKL
jgi:hypothetical protein